jgi:hypothetical protein
LHLSRLDPVLERRLVNERLDSSASIETELTEPHSSPWMKQARPSSYRVIDDPSVIGAKRSGVSA